MIESEQHFDIIAHEYDFWKNKNRYYYDNLKLLLGSLIPKGKRVLEIGCGTGDLLSFLQPATGLGVDISTEMVKLAQIRHRQNKALSFIRANVLSTFPDFSPDFVFMSDVLEHVEEVGGFLSAISRSIGTDCKLVVTLANPIWEPVLMLAEKLSMKMPEGPHNRLSLKKTEALFLAADLTIKEKGYRLLVPKKFFLSDWINKRFHHNKLLARLGFVVFWVLEKKSINAIVR